MKFKKWKKARKAWKPKARVDRLGVGDCAIVTVPKSQQHAQLQILRTLDTLSLSLPLGIPTLAFTISGDSYVSLTKYLQSANNWAGVLSNMYDEFRPLGVRVKYVPYGKFDGGTTTTSQPINIPIVMCYDNDGSIVGVPTATTIAAYGTSKLYSSSDAWEVYFKFCERAKDEWYDVNVPGNWLPQLAVAPVLYGTPSLTAGQMGSLLVEVDVIMRGVR